MDAATADAARALAGGDALAALARVSLRGDAPALALQGIAMARLGEHAAARALLQRAMRGFAPRDAPSRARCLVADAEIALATRDLSAPPAALAAAAKTLDAAGDAINAAHARTVLVRRSLLLGRLADARAQLRALEGALLPPALAATAALAAAELALRALRTAPAREALAMARASAGRAGIAALLAEIDAAGSAFELPAARRIDADGAHTLRIAEVEALFASGALVVDGCRPGVRVVDAWLPLAGRPVLFALARTLAAAWPGDADRDVLIAAAFRIRRVDDTHRVRLRVELGRLRALLAPWAGIEATMRGFALVPAGGRAVAVIVPPFDGDQAMLLALLGDGEAWSTTALALATGTGQRTVQRALAALEAEGRVRAVGAGRTRRWLAPPLGGFATTLLLPAAAAHA